jgi:DHA1 family inner membrane transport protein
MLGAFGGNQPVAITCMILWRLFFGGIPSVMAAQPLSSASPRIRDQAAAFLTVSFNTGIGGGALIGGVIVDRLGLGTLPWGRAAFITAAIMFVVGTVLYASRPTPAAASVR